MNSTSTSTSTELLAERLRDVFLVFLKLGLTAFGGPAAHVGLFHDEIVRRRRWLNDQEFLDLLGATNLIPGPNSTEMAIHVGRLRAGWLGLIAGGVGFILPAMLLVMALAAAYVRFGATPQVNWLLLGIKPVIIAIIAQALWALGQKALTDRVTMAAAGLALALALVGVNELALLFGITLAVMLIRNWRFWPRAAGALALPWGLSWMVAAGAAPFTLARLFLTFLKIGSVLYGSGYVLFAFVRADFVLRLGWLSDRQLIDAIAVGQVTPGPLFTTATFIGYLLGGAVGAVLATVGIFLPAFIFVAISGPLIPRLRTSPWAGALLDGANAASLGLMAAVTWQLARAAFSDWFTVGLGLLSALLLLRFRIPTTWLLLGGAAAGLGMMLAR
ncbi:chromate efflux transporter [Candidatus Amarolinea dominans]|uniref:chromate efflux transporter n=1 Tax=Candidatus Amarolinea dominans TaxID=3140696 RepID=UPI0031346B07|nr:chromate efflux transporter [Anaerolineae bacterium]